MDDLRVIVVTGLPGTGKTTLARELSARYRIPLVAKDVIKEPLLDVLGARDAAESRRLSDASFSVLFALARELGTAVTGLVLEGNFRPGEHESPLRLLFPAGLGDGRVPPLAQVLCTAPERERLARLAARRTNPTRHPGHRDSDQASSPPAALSGSFLELPGERFVHDGAPGRAVLGALDRWWTPRTISRKNPSPVEPRR